MWRERIDAGCAANPHAPAGRLDKAAVPAQIATTGANAAVDVGCAAGIGQVSNQCGRATLAGAVGSGVYVDAAAVADAVAGFEADHAAGVAQAIGFEHAAVVDHAALQAVGRLRRQDDQAAGRLHGMAVLHQRGDAGRCDADIGQRVVAVKLQLIGIACGEHHGA